MAITLRTATGTFATGTNTSMVGTEPAGTAQNDVLFALVIHENPANAISPPAGWTPLWSGGSLSAGASGFYYWAGYIVRGASAPSLTWTATGSVYFEVHIIGLVGCDTTTPVDASSSSGTTYTSTAKPDPPAATAGPTTDMAVTCAAQWGGSQGTAWGHAAYTIRSNNTLGNDGIVASRLLSASGSEDPAAFTDGTLLSADGWNGGTVLFKEPAAAPAYVVDVPQDPILVTLQPWFPFMPIVPYPDLTAAVASLATFVSIGLPSEIDTALTLLAQKQRTLGLPTETDTALTLGRTKARTLGLPAETDTALSITGTHARVFPMGLPSETDSALSLTRSKTKTIGLPQEADTSLPMSRAKFKPLGLNTETDSALGLSKKKQRAMGFPSETNTALSFTRAKRRSTGLPSETDTALSITIATGKRTLILNLVSELDTALPFEPPLRIHVTPVPAKRYYVIRKGNRVWRITK